MSSATATHDIVGFYSLTEAARIIPGLNWNKVKRWVFGDSPKGSVLHPQYSREETDGHYKVGFYNLLELNYVRSLVDMGFSLNKIRKALKEASENLGTSFPFLYRDASFRTDRKSIFLETSEGERVDLLNLRTGHYEMLDLVDVYVKKLFEYKKGELLPTVWHPEPKKFPNIVLDPDVDWGLPSLRVERIGTRHLYESWKGDGGSVETVAEWYDLGSKSVDEAVRFERWLSENHPT